MLEQTLATLTDSLIKLLSGWQKSATLRNFDKDIFVLKTIFEPFLVLSM